MKKQITSVIALVLATSNIAYGCWVERVERDEKGLKIFMQGGYEKAIKSVFLNGNYRTEPIINADRSVTIREKDSVLIGTTHHDTCTGTAVLDNGVLKLKLEASSCSPSQSCSRSTNFVTPK